VPASASLASSATIFWSAAPARAASSLRRWLDSAANWASLSPRIDPADGGDFTVVRRGRGENCKDSLAERTDSPAAATGELNIDITTEGCSFFTRAPRADLGCGSFLVFIGASFSFACPRGCRLARALGAGGTTTRAWHTGAVSKRRDWGKPPIGAWLGLGGCRGCSASKSTVFFAGRAFFAGGGAERNEASISRALVLLVTGLISSFRWAWRITYPGTARDSRT